MRRNNGGMGIYVHIPFCVKKCDYCDFLSAPAGVDEQRRYMEALREEIRMVSKMGADANCFETYTEIMENDVEESESILEIMENSSEKLKLTPEMMKSESGTGPNVRRNVQRSVDTIFFGGGTPSILPAEEIARTMEIIRACFDVAEDAEITVECNPGTLTEEKCRSYRACGVNRLSIGLQSADNRLLKYIGRIHTFEEFLESYHAARRAGFTNINIDLMSGLPGQSVQDHVDTLQKVLALKPEHISAYSLILEEGTPLYERVLGHSRSRSEDSFSMGAGEKKSNTKYAHAAEAEKTDMSSSRLDSGMETEEEFVRSEEKMKTERNMELQRTSKLEETCMDLLPSEDEEMEMYVKTREILEAHGYHRYEISNYSLPKKECRHNLRYWGLLDYYGFGIGAASFVDGCRFKNTDDRKKYIELLQSGLYEKLHAEFQRETDRELMEEFVFLGLRKIKGIRTDEFAGRFGQEFDSVYGNVRKKLIAQGFLKKSADGVCLSLTDRGIDFSNEVLAEFLQ